MDQISIGRHLLQPDRQLLRDGEHVHLGPRALSILTVLARAEGEIVTKDELMDAVWPTVTVEENALQVHIAALRKALGPDAGLLRTLRGIGYQLLAVDEGRQDRPASAEAELSQEHSRDADGPVEATGSRRFSKRTVATTLAAFGLAAIAMIGWYVTAGDGSARANGPTALVVLPFEIGGDTEWERREKALTASIAGSLARVPGIEMTSETTADTVSGLGLTPQEMGDRLGIDHMVEGDILATDDKLVAQLRLIGASSGRPVWTGEVATSRHYADELEPLILNRLSGVILARRRAGESDYAIPGDIDPRARAAYVEGLSHLTFSTPVSYGLALRSMQMAVSIEPDFAAAHAGIAYVLALGTNNYFSIKPEAYARTQNALMERAFEGDPNNFMARLARGYADLHLRGDIEAGIETGRELVAQSPEDPHANAFLSQAYRYAGESQRALAHIDRAIAADPFNFVFEVRRRHILIDMGDYLGVKQAATSCRVQCWLAGLNWWEALTMHGNKFQYTDVSAIAALYDDERAYSAGSATRTQSIMAHGDFLFGDRSNPLMQDFSDNGFTGGISHWMLMVMRYGYIDEGFSIAMRGIDMAPALAVLPLLTESQLTLPPEVRADPRYHAIFEIPRFKAVADYRKSKGMTAGLPVFPVQPYRDGR